MAEDKKKKSDGEGEESNVARIYYIGDDITFFKNLEEKYRAMVSSVDCVFEQHYTTKPDEIQSYLLQIREMRPKMVLIDFSKDTLQTLHLARLVARQNFYVHIPIIGLCEYKQAKSLVVKAIMATIPCVHVKSAEFESIVYDINVLAFPEKVDDHGFATAQMNDEIKVYHPCKVSMINENFIRIESNYQMQPKQMIRLNNFWYRQQTVKSSLTMCADQSQDNVYYNYKYTQVLQMAHADPVEQTDNMTKEDFDNAQAKRQETIVDSRNLLKRWLKENSGNSRPKFLKAYVVDKEGLFFKDRPMSDAYSFVFRCQPFMANCKKEITNIRPQLIIYNLEDVPKEELEANADIAHTFNDSRMFQHLIKTIGEVLQGYQPIIIVFNTGQYDSAYMQKVFNYQSIMAVQDEMDVDLVLKMAEMLKNKISPNLPQPNEGDIYIDKSADISYAELEAEITMLGCSENDIFFNSDEEIPEGTVLRVSLPIPMYFTVVKPPENAKIPSSYYGILHGIGEEERQELRRYINAIFFRDLENQKEQERADVEKQKEDYIRQKQEADEEEAEE